MAGAGERNRQPRNSVPQLQQLITDWERRVDAMANRVMGTDEFSRSMNTLHRLQIGMQKAFMQTMATHLNNLNMPSRTDVTELGETLAALEKRMARMEARLDRLDGDPGAVRRPRTGPPRTRQPPSKQAAPPPDPQGGSAS